SSSTPQIIIVPEITVSEAAAGEAAAGEAAAGEAAVGEAAAGEAAAGEAAAGEAAEPSPSSVTLAAGQTATVHVKISVPLNAVAGATNVAQLNVLPANNPHLSQNFTLAASVAK
ncbi:MAG: hypothetical protein ACKO4U_11945, partial [Caldilinea sp.]